uniref:Malonyl-CoA decarboxylase-like n=1 Tax=Rhizophora mucronata TaxID=61149 RepID=A0A2P2LMN5_RHIMU
MIVVCGLWNWDSWKQHAPQLKICKIKFRHFNVKQMIERMNWMADRSEKGLHQSGGIMVNYVYRYFL